MLATCVHVPSPSTVLQVCPRGDGTIQVNDVLSLPEFPGTVEL